MSWCRLRLSPDSSVSSMTSAPDTGLEGPGENSVPKEPMASEPCAPAHAGGHRGRGEVAATRRGEGLQGSGETPSAPEAPAPGALVHSCVERWQPRRKRPAVLRGVSLSHTSALVLGVRGCITSPWSGPRLTANSQEVRPEAHRLQGAFSPTTDAAESVPGSSTCSHAQRAMVDVGKDARGAGPAWEREVPSAVPGRLR